MDAAVEVDVAVAARDAADDANLPTDEKAPLYWIWDSWSDSGDAAKDDFDADDLVDGTNAADGTRSRPSDDSAVTDATFMISGLYSTFEKGRG